MTSMASVQMDRTDLFKGRYLAGQALVRQVTGMPPGRCAGRCPGSTSARGAKTVVPSGSGDRVSGLHVHGAHRIWRSRRPPCAGPPPARFRELGCSQPPPERFETAIRWPGSYSVVGGSSHMTCPDRLVLMGLGGAAEQRQGAPLTPSPAPVSPGIAERAVGSPRLGGRLAEWRDVDLQACLAARVDRPALETSGRYARLGHPATETRSSPAPASDASRAVELTLSPSAGQQAAGARVRQCGAVVKMAEHSGAGHRVTPTRMSVLDIWSRRLDSPEQGARRATGASLCPIILARCRPDSTSAGHRPPSRPRRRPNQRRTAFHRRTARSPPPGRCRTWQQRMLDGTDRRSAIQVVAIDSPNRRWLGYVWVCVDPKLVAYWRNLCDDC